MGQTMYFARNSRIAVVPSGGGAPRSISDQFDENPAIVDWTSTALFFSASQKTASHLFRMTPDFSGGFVCQVPTTRWLVASRSRRTAR